MSAPVRLSVRLGARLSLLASSALLLLFLGAPSASAHPTLLSTDPEAGYSVGAAPRTVTMVFDEPVRVEARGVRVEDDRGREVRTGDVKSEQDGRRLVVAVLDELGPGRYVVRWQVTAQDGDVVDANFDFAVAGSAATLRGRDQAVTAAFPLVGALRFVFFLCVAGLIGALAGQAIARRAVPDAVGPRSIVRPAALAGTLAAAGLVIQLAVATDGLGRAGYLLLIEVVGLAAVVALGNRVPWWLLLPPIGLVIAAESLRNHVGSQRGLAGAVLLAVHLVAVAVWVGTLAHLLRVAHANRGRAVRTMRAFVVYSRLALWVFLAVAATGTVAALLLVPSVGALTGTAYGRVLTVKLALVAAVVVLAWIGRRRLRTPPVVPTRATRYEAAILVGVLGVSAVLVGLPTPAPATADLGYPPPVSGPAIRLGTLAGQIAVGIAASENRLEVRLRVPDTGDEVGAGRPPGYKLSVSVSPPGRAAAVVALQPCGTGCFIGPVQWSTGLSYVDLRVDADEWQGGSAAFPISWAPSVVPDLLPKVRAAMAAQTSFRVAETVTSDTSRPAPKPQSLTTNGREFLSSEPYGSSPDPDVVLPAGPQRHNLVAFALPAEGIYVELEIDASYRIIREKLAAPKHLTERTFTYSR